MVETEVMIRTSERTCFKSCRQKWWWAYVDLLKSKDPRPPLTFGDLVHQALAAWYVPGRVRKGHPAKHLVRIYRKQLKDGMPEIFPLNDDHQVTAEDLGVEMLNNYVLEYGQDERYEVVQSEMAFQVDVFHPKTGKYLYTYVGQIDGVWRDLITGYLIILESKTGASLTPFGSPEPLDEQSGSYLTFAPGYLQAKGILAPDEFPDYVLFNRLKKAFADTRPKNEQGHSLNKDGTVSKRQPDPLFKRSLVYRSEADRISMMNRVFHEAREQAMVRSGKLGVYKNPDRHCGWCEFRDMCEVHETGSDWKAVRKSMFTVWEPYSAHEIAAERSH